MYSATTTGHNDVLAVDRITSIALMYFRVQTIDNLDKLSDYLQELQLVLFAVRLSKSPDWQLKFLSIN